MTQPHDQRHIFIVATQLIHSAHSSRHVKTNYKLHVKENNTRVQQHRHKWHSAAL